MAIRWGLVLVMGWVLAQVRSWSGGGAPMASGVDAMTAAFVDCLVGALVVLVVWAAGGLLAGAAVRLPGAAGRAAARMVRWLVPRTMRATVLAVAGAQVAAVGSTAVAGGAAWAATPIVSNAAAGVGVMTSVAGEVAGADGVVTDGTSWPQVGRPTTTRPAQVASTTAATPHPPPGDASATIIQATDVVAVGPGDSLWAIAQRHLGAEADPAAIDREWRRWYGANQATVGPDPNVLLVGMLLRAPEPAGDQR